MDSFKSIKIIRQIRDRYELGPLFAFEYLKHWFNPETLKNLDLDNLNLSPLDSLWFDFALSTNIRGDGLFNEIAPFLPKSGKRYLDVGCGYGGFMVAFHKRGYQVTGLDIDPGLVALSLVNLKDFKIERPVHLADILSDRVKEILGTYDVITCNDVIEHVECPSLCLERLTDLLAPGGVLSLKIPNKDSIKYVTSDGHYNLFGITLLDHDLASRYHHSFFSAPYGVGEYHPLNYYLQELKKYRCSTLVIGQDQYLHFRQVPRQIIKLLSQYRRFMGDIKTKIPIDIKREMKRNFISYLLRLLVTLFNPISMPSFRERYMTDFWSVLAIKS